MSFIRHLRAIVLGATLLATAPGTLGCGNDNVVTAQARDLRGRVPAGRGITRVTAVDAKTRRVVATATPDAQGNFVLTGLRKGATYKLTVLVGRSTRPLVFRRIAGLAGKTNLFRIGTRRCVGATSCLEGPMDVDMLTEGMEGNEPVFQTSDERAPNMQEDFDEDGMPDGTDADADGDGMPNAMDSDNDGDGMPDNITFNDTDNDGITNESDRDADGDGIANPDDPDADGDMMPDAMETDRDGDGIPDAMDPDRDGDGVPNTEDDSPDGLGARE